MLNNIVWTIAGSDCSGGAGIQADIKAIHNLGCEACSIITANTAQNTEGVIEINAVSDDVLISQFKALEHHKTPAAIKIGMLANKRQILLVAEWLTRLKSSLDVPPFVVYDPVAVASSGGDLTEEEVLPTVIESLLPLIDLITPNANEVQRLTGVYLIGWSSLSEAAAKLMQQGVGAVVIKGGHLDIVDDYSVDYCSNGNDEYWLASKRIASEHSHGSGCTFASAMASLLAQGYLLRDSFAIAKAFINQGLKASSEYEGIYGPVWQGNWPSNVNDFAEVLVNGSELAQYLDWNEGQNRVSFATEFTTVGTDNLGLYPVVGTADWIERLLKAGVETIQLRAKTLQGDELEAEIKRAIALGEQYQARVFINDYWQLAIKHKAYGVHLGQEDIEEADIAAIKQAGLRLGISTHGHYEFIKAKQYQPSYLAVGAIFPTKTKDMTGQIQGIDTLAKLVKLKQDMPMVAIGGINLSNVKSVVETDVGCVAVVTAVTEAESPEAAVDALEAVITN